MRWQFRYEPTAWMALVRAAVVFGAAWGFEMTEEQSLAIYALAEAVTSLINRSFVTPTERP